MLDREKLRENWPGQLWTAFVVTTIRGLGNLAFHLPYVGRDSVLMAATYRGTFLDVSVRSGIFWNDGLRKLLSGDVSEAK